MYCMQTVTHVVYFKSWNTLSSFRISPQLNHYSLNDVRAQTQLSRIHGSTQLGKNSVQLVIACTCVVNNTTALNMCTDIMPVGIRISSKHTPIPVSNWEKKSGLYTAVNSELRTTQPIKVACNGLGSSITVTSVDMLAAAIWYAFELIAIQLQLVLKLKGKYCDNNYR